MEVLRRLFSPPNAEEYEHDKKVKFLHTTLWVAFVAMLVFGFLNSKSVVGNTAKVFFLTAVICLLGLLLNAAGKYFWAARLFTVVVLFANFYNFYDGVSLADAAIIAFPVILIFSSFLFGKRAILPITLVNLGTIALMVYYERSGVINPPELTSDERIIIITVLLLAGAILLRAIMDNWESSLERARSSEQRLRIALEAVSDSRDQLEQRVVERTSDLQHANKELEAFAYSVSHDLRAPLRAIGGFAGVLVEDFSRQLEPEGLIYLEKIVASANRMNTLIDDMLQLSKVGRDVLSKNSVNLCEVVNDIFSKLSESDQLEGVEILVKKCPPADVDLNLASIMLTNLISNALKFSRGKAPIEIEFGSRDEKGKVVYYLRDNGIGFNIAYAEKIFSPFQRLHGQDEYEGTGIGLAIVQRIIERHNGEVWFESELDKGTTVFFSFPLQANR